MVEYSVVVCTYNRGKLIEKCINSLIAQDIPRSKYEIIVVNDGSVDNTLNILKKYRKFRNFRIINQKHLGLAAARNTGWENAKGEIVLYIDDDAVADKNWIRTTISNYEKGIDGVGGTFRPIERNWITIYTEGSMFLFYGRHGEKLDGGGGLNMSFRKRALKAIGGFDPAFTDIADDADINKRFIESGRRLKVCFDITVRHKEPKTLRDFMIKRFKRGKSYIFVKKYRPNCMNIRYVAGFLYRLLNIPLAVLHGIKIASIEKKYRLTLHFIFLVWIQGICQNLGLLYYSLRGK